MRLHRNVFDPTPALAILALAAAMSGCAAERPPAPSEVPTALSARDPLADAASALAATDTRRLVQSSWRASLGGAAGSVSISDDKQLLVLPSGDFDLSVRRVHEGAEAGRSAETYRAVRTGREFFTRGSGGPFVRWDDAVDEPAAAASALAHESRALLEGLSSCAGVAWTGNSGTLRLAKVPCTAKPGGLLDGASIELRELGGEVRVGQGALLHASLMLRGRISTPSGARDAALTWRVDASDPGPNARVEAPADVLDGRRERPVRMAEEVLGALGEPWGPGAAGALREAAGRKSSASEGED